MFSLPFFIVDVFAEKQLTGNQLAVVLNANALTDWKEIRNKLPEK